jgi:hypothetical protein
MEDCKTEECKKTEESNRNIGAKRRNGKTQEFCKDWSSEHMNLSSIGIKGLVVNIIA